MFIDTDSIVINTVDMGQYLTSAKFGYHKVWSEDTGRNIAGSMTGTLLGIFPKLTLSFKPHLTQAELEILAPVLDASSQSVTYYDPNKKTDVTMTTYTGDWELTNKQVAKNEGFDCAFISTSKRV
jgi:hypothetical protein